METSAKLLVALNLLGVAQALLLAAALFSVKRGNRIANRFLAAFVIVIAIGVGGATMAQDRFIILYPHLLKIQDPFFILGAPLLYLYVRTLIKGRAGSGKRDLLHFLPFALCLLYLLPFYFLSSKAKLFSVASYFDFWARWGYIKLQRSSFSSLFTCLSSPRCSWPTRENSSVKPHQVKRLSFSRFVSCSRPSQLFWFSVLSNSYLP